MKREIFWFSQLIIPKSLAQNKPITMKQVEHFMLYEKRQNGILHENYYGRDTKSNRDVYVKIFETKKVPDLQPLRTHINNEIMI